MNIQQLIAGGPGSGCRGNDCGRSKGNSGAIAVDLDATLAQYHGWAGAHHIGKPIPAMVDSIKRALANGRKVIIFTARIAHDPTGSVKKAIQDWSKKHIGVVLPVTNVKTPEMSEFWDDRAKHVRPNKGVFAGVRMNMSQLLDVRASVKECPHCHAVQSSEESGHCSKCGAYIGASVEAGGPGSGRHPGDAYQEAAKHAQEVSRRAMVSGGLKSAHIAARNAHIAAMKLAPTGWQQEFHERNARQHNAYSIKASAKLTERNIVQMPYPEFKKEHQHLPRVLRRGTQKQQEDEARDQAQELNTLSKRAKK